MGPIDTELFWSSTNLTLTIRDSYCRRNSWRTYIYMPPYLLSWWLWRHAVTLLSVSLSLYLFLNAVRLSYQREQCLNKEKFSTAVSNCCWRRASSQALTKSLTNNKIFHLIYDSRLVLDLCIVCCSKHQTFENVIRTIGKSLQQIRDWICLDYSNDTTFKLNRIICVKK